MKLGDLEIEIRRQPSQQYSLDLRFTAPDSDRDVRLLRQGPRALQASTLTSLAGMTPTSPGYGGRLAQALFADPAVQQALAEAKAVALSHGEALRVRLLLDNSVPELNRIHWECLRDAAGNSVFTGERVLFSRYLSTLDWTPAPLEHRGQLRVVMAVANPSDLAAYTPGGQPLAPVDAPAIVQRTCTAIGPCRLATVETVTLEALKSALRDGCDVLYLVCHGALIDGEPWLWLQDTSGQACVTAGQELVTALGQLPQAPRLVVLASCQSAGAPHEAPAESLAAIGPRLAIAGVPAVLAMQGNLSMKSEELFMPVFFQELRRDGLIDRAVAAARCRIQDRADAWVPVLYMRLRSGCLLPAQPAPSRRAWIYAAGGAFASLSLTGGVVYSRSRFRSQDVRSLAVLPMSSVTSDAALEELGAGFAEDVISGLSRMRNLRVLSRTATFRFRGQQVDPLEQGRKLGADAILTGTLRRRGEQMEISLELVHIASGTQLWGERFDMPAANPLAAKAAVIERVSARLQDASNPGERRRVNRDYTANLNAYRLYLKGRAEWNKRTRAGYEAALDLYQKALAEDPNYALAYSGLADAYAMLDGARPTEVVYPLARTAASQALRIDQELAEAHSSLGFIALQYDWDWAAAEKSFLRAIELSPSYSSAYSYYARLLTVLGRFKEAEERAKKAQQLDPLHIGISNNLANTYFMARQFDRAEAQLKVSLEFDPQSLTARVLLASNAAQTGRTEESLAIFRKLTSELPGDTGIQATMAWILAQAGQKAEAEKILKAIRPKGEVPKGALLGFAELFGVLGQPDEALQLLELAYQKRVWGLMYLNVSPYWDPLRQHNGFQRLLVKMNLTRG